LTGLPEVTDDNGVTQRDVEVERAVAMLDNPAPMLMDWRIDGSHAGRMQLKRPSEGRRTWTRWYCVQRSVCR
jgi:hypothetical protein